MRHGELLVAMDRHDIDILAVNETWLRFGLPEEWRAPGVSLVPLASYPAPQPVAVSSRGGGVGFCIFDEVSQCVCWHIHLLTCRTNVDKSDN